MTRPQSPVRRDSLLASEDGAVLVEYIAVWGLAAVGIAIAITTLGPPLLTSWGLAKATLLANKP
jgi:Flp pilus assembly pilin Flp